MLDLTKIIALDCFNTLAINPSFYFLSNLAMQPTVETVPSKSIVSLTDIGIPKSPLSNKLLSFSNN